MNEIPVFIPSGWSDWELIDSGGGEKLERYGDYIVSRPDPRVLWAKNNPAPWEKADALFIRTSSTEGNWHFRSQPPDPWHISWNTLTFTLRPTEFKHVGVFPEQATNWQWLNDTIHDRPLTILNLFAYTGGSTLAAISAGATVTHVDAAKSAIDWAHANLTASHLPENRVRWILDDAIKFVLRESRRGNKYDGIIMDPPRFGRGTKGEVWKLEKDLPKLLSAAEQILAPDGFLLVNTYTADISSVTLGNAVASVMKKRHGTLTSGELAAVESGSGRLLPNGIVARWRTE